MTTDGPSQFTHVEFDDSPEEPRLTVADRILTRIRAIEPNPLATSPAQAVRFALKDAEGIIVEEMGGKE